MHWTITDADRDERGRIRTLAELLPAKEIAQPAAPPAQPLRITRKEIAGAVGAGLAAVALLVLLRGAPTERPAATVTIRPTAVAPAAVVLPTAAPTALPQQAAYAAPDGALLGTVPAGLPAAYRYGSAGWAGVLWQGAIVWVRADAGTLAGLPDLKPQPTAAPVWSAPAPPPVVEAAPTSKALGQKQHDKLPCWKGPPTPIREGQVPCWEGVPFVMPGGE